MSPVKAAASKRKSEPLPIGNAPTDAERGSAPTVPKMVGEFTTVTPPDAPVFNFDPGTVDRQNYRYVRATVIGGGGVGVDGRPSWLRCAISDSDYVGNPLRLVEAGRVEVPTAESTSLVVDLNDQHHPGWTPDAFVNRYARDELRLVAVNYVNTTGQPQSVTLRVELLEDNAS